MIALDCRSHRDLDDAGYALVDKGNQNALVWGREREIDEQPIATGGYCALFFPCSLQNFTCNECSINPVIDQFGAAGSMG
jgi:hypothetical protein